MESPVDDALSDDPDELIEQDERKVVEGYNLSDSITSYDACLRSHYVCDRLRIAIFEGFQKYHKKYKNETTFSFAVKLSKLISVPQRTLSRILQGAIQDPVFRPQPRNRHHPPPPPARHIFAAVADFQQICRQMGHFIRLRHREGKPVYARELKGLIKWKFQVEISHPTLLRLCEYFHFEWRISKKKELSREKREVIERDVVRYCEELKAARLKFQDEVYLDESYVYENEYNPFSWMIDSHDIITVKSGGGGKRYKIIAAGSKLRGWIGTFENKVRVAEVVEPSLVKRHKIIRQQLATAEQTKIPRRDYVNQNMKERAEIRARLETGRPLRSKGKLREELEELQSANFLSNNNPQGDENIASHEAKDYHGLFNSDSFEAWFRLLLNELGDAASGKPRCIIIMDNASYHSRYFISQGVSAMTQDQALNYISAMGTAEERASCKIGDKIKPLKELRAIAGVILKRDKPVVCRMAEALGHTVIFTPASQSEFNPIEHAWGIIKKYVRDRYELNLSGANTLKNTKDAFDYITPATWARMVQHTDDSVNFVLDKNQRDNHVTLEDIKLHHKHAQQHDNTAPLLPHVAIDYSKYDLPETATAAPPNDDTVLPDDGEPLIYFQSRDLDDSQDEESE